MLVGKWGGANDASGRQRLPQGSMDPRRGAAAARMKGRKQAGWVPKILVNRQPVTIWQEINGYQMVNFYRRS
jgi:hypothetical protein